MHSNAVTEGQHKVKQLPDRGDTEEPGEHEDLDGRSTVLNFRALSPLTLRHEANVYKRAANTHETRSAHI